VDPLRPKSASPGWHGARIFPGVFGLALALTPTMSASTRRAPDANSILLSPGPSTTCAQAAGREDEALLRVISTLLAALTFVVCLAPHATASPNDSRLRAIDGRLARLIEEARRRCVTFARMARELEHSDVILYLVPGRDLPSDLLGRMTLMSEGRGVRYLRAEIRMQQTGADVVGTIAHELQHALEIAAAPLARDECGIRRLYGEIGRSRRANRFDTKAAKATGWLVRSEFLAD
jgi:hypothetical protein